MEGISSVKRGNGEEKRIRGREEGGGEQGRVGGATQ